MEADAHTLRRPSVPCAVRTMGLIQRQPYHSTPLTKQGDVMLTVVIGGRGRVVTEGYEQGVESGMVGLVPGDGTGVLMSDPRDPYIHYYSRFSGDYARSLVRRVRSHRSRPFFSFPNVLELASRLHRHVGISRDQLPGRCGTEGLDVLAVLEEIDAGTDASLDPSTSLPLDRRIRNYLFEHVAEPTVLDTIAADLGVSRATLSRMARSATGASVQQLHEQIKIDWAATLLRSTSGCVGEIARRVGYHDQFYFSRVFRKHTGRPPREYARNPRREARARCSRRGDPR
jgi:AraC-like DNA-binding protein